MTGTQNRVTACLNSALQSFNQNEQYLISRDLSERCICAKFASYLERAIAESEFCEYVVDVEYNRGSRGNEHAATPMCTVSPTTSTRSTPTMVRTLSSSRNFAVA